MIFWDKLRKDQHLKSERWAIITLLIGFMLMGTTHFISQWSIFQSLSSRETLNRQFQISSLLYEIERHLLDVENEIQYYILTEDREYLKKIKTHFLHSQQKMEEIDQLLRLDSSDPVTEFEVLRKSVVARIDYNSDLLEGFRLEDPEYARQVLIRKQEKILLDDFSRNKEAFLKARNIGYEAGEQNRNKDNKRIFFFDNLGFLLGVGLLIFALVYLLRGIGNQIALRENLIESKQEVEKSAEVKEQFLANMSHEIRTPLQAILGFTNLLLKDNLDPKHHQYVGQVKTASENLLNIVNDILDVSKIESGMIRQESTLFSLSGLLHSIDNMFKAKILEKDISFNIHPNPEVPDKLVGDAVHLTRILFNLIGNAIKFTEQGGIDIFQELISQTKGLVKIKLVVKDTGIGIPDEKLPYIFDRFEQVDSQVTRSYGGSGLGLHIVKQLVELQGGKIEVESKLNVGTTFSLELNYQMGDDEALVGTKEGNRVDLGNSFHHIRILLVEDNLMNQRVISIFLDEQGINFDLASNGKEAILQIEKEEYDLILMDVQMPEMDGYSATDYIRNKLQKSVPIIAMTAHAFPGEREKALSYGMNEYISKPIREDDLFRIISGFVPLVRELEISSKKETFVESQIETEVPEIDYNFLMQTSKGKKEYLEEILNLFLSQGPIQYEELCNRLKNGDTKQVKKIAHSLKSTVGYAGLNAYFLPLLESIEEASENDRKEKLQKLVGNLGSRLELALEKVALEALPLVKG